MYKNLRLASCARFKHAGMIIIYCHTWLIHQLDPGIQIESDGISCMFLAEEFFNSAHRKGFSGSKVCHSSVIVNTTCDLFI